MDKIKFTQDLEEFLEKNGIEQWIICIVHQGENKKGNMGLIGSENSEGIKDLMRKFYDLLQSQQGINFKSDTYISKKRG